jgi:hypothetical protein
LECDPCGTREESFRWNLYVYSTGNKLYCGIEPSPRLKCSGGTLVLRKLIGKWKRLCGNPTHLCCKVWIVNWNIKDDVQFNGGKM